jgi:hypothetical protein
MLNAAITSLDANWHYLIAIPQSRVDLIAHYPTATIAAEGTIELINPNPFVILRNAIYNSNEEIWCYRNSTGVDVAIPDNCQPLAWRPAHIRQDAAARIVDIKRMIKFLNFVGVIQDPVQITSLIIEKAIVQDHVVPKYIDSIKDIILAVY